MTKVFKNNLHQTNIMLTGIKKCLTWTKTIKGSINWILTWCRINNIFQNSSWNLNYLCYGLCQDLWMLKFSLMRTCIYYSWVEWKLHRNTLFSTILTVSINLSSFLCIFNPKLEQLNQLKSTNLMINDITGTTDMNFGGYLS